MPRKTDIKKLITQNERRLQKLKEQEASMGLQTPAHILLEIEDTQEVIEELNAEIKILESQGVLTQDVTHSPTEKVHIVTPTNREKRLKRWLLYVFKSDDAVKVATVLATVIAFLALIWAIYMYFNPNPSPTPEGTAILSGITPGATLMPTDTPTLVITVLPTSVTKEPTIIDPSPSPSSTNTPSTTPILVTNTATISPLLTETGTNTPVVVTSTSTPIIIFSTTPTVSESIQPHPVLLSTPECKMPIVDPPQEGINVTDSITLCWDYNDELAEDEYFDIKIRRKGDDKSVFVDWIKKTSYELNPWKGWYAADYTVQIGVIKGYFEGDEKRLIEDKKRDSELLIIKWKNAGAGSNGDDGPRFEGP